MKRGAWRLFFFVRALSGFVSSKLQLCAKARWILVRHYPKMSLLKHAKPIKNFRNSISVLGIKHPIGAKRAK